MRILIIEDEKELLKDLAKGLTVKGYAVDQAENGMVGYQMAVDEEYDLVILDLNLPGLDGFSVLDKLRRERPESKILILSADTRLDSKLAGFELGASDYLTKPFHFAELEARIRVLLNRMFVQQPCVLTYHGLSVNTRSRTALYHDVPLELTAKEFSILEYFFLHQGRLITQQELIGHVWNGEADPFSNSIRVHLSAMRKKLKTVLGYDPIQTKIGEGYLLL